MGTGTFFNGLIYLYDKADDGFGSAENLACGWCSEWGYAPFGGLGDGAAPGAGPAIGRSDHAPLR